MKLKARQNNTNQWHSRCQSIRGIRIHSRQHSKYFKDKTLRPQSGFVDHRNFNALSSTVKSNQDEMAVFIIKRSNNLSNNLPINNSLGTQCNSNLWNS